MSKRSSSAKYNENYSHICSSTLVNRDQLKSSFVDAGYTPTELARIIDFYLTHAPINRGEDASSPSRWLGEYGWKGASDLRSLESQLLKSSGIQSFIMLKSARADMTINAMQLGDEICAEHPRAIMTLSCKTVVNEDGTVTVTPHETRMVCLFRHIRNALAHGLCYVLPNGNLLLDDKNEYGKTASMVIHAKTLANWVQIVDKNSLYYQVAGD